MTDYERVTTRETSQTLPPDAVAEETVVRRPVVDPGVAPIRDRVSTTEYVAHPSPAEVLRRIVALIFGILQASLVIRVILLLLAANRANEIVRFVLDVTTPFVEPFRGMFRLDTVTAGGTGSELDVAALVALVGWTLVEALVLAIVSIGSRRTTTYA
jgi:uncharacterized protein YggT (Ycf19 family)